MIDAREEGARLLMGRLGENSRFGCLPHNCEADVSPGVHDLPTWRIWTRRATTPGQLRIEDQLENLVNTSSFILHVGAGNSSLGRRFAPRVSGVLGTTISEEERIFSESLGIPKYTVVVSNKFTVEMDHIEGPFDFIVDSNPSGFACCLFHFSRMMISYAELLRKNGGLLLTDRQGLGWVCDGNHPNWSFGWSEWEKLGEILHMPVQHVTEDIFSMQRTNR